MEFFCSSGSVLLKKQQQLQQQSQHHQGPSINQNQQHTRSQLKKESQASNQHQSSYHHNNQHQQAHPSLSLSNSQTNTMNNGSNVSFTTDSGRCLPSQSIPSNTASTLVNKNLQNMSHSPSDSPQQQMIVSTSVTQNRRMVPTRLETSSVPSVAIGIDPINVGVTPSDVKRLPSNDNNPSGMYLSI